MISPILDRLRIGAFWCLLAVCLPSPAEADFFRWEYRYFNPATDEWYREDVDKLSGEPEVKLAKLPGFSDWICSIQTIDAFIEPDQDHRLESKDITCALRAKPQNSFTLNSLCIFNIMTHQLRQKTDSTFTLHNHNGEDLVLTLSCSPSPTQAQPAPSKP